MESTPRRSRDFAMRWSRATGHLFSKSEAGERARFLRSHAWWPLLAFALAIGIVALANTDWILARALFAWQGNRWHLKEAFITEDLIHSTGRALSSVAWLATLIAWIVALRRPRLAEWRVPLGYLVLTVLISTSLVSWIKSWSNMDCPWDVSGLGGAHPYLGLLEWRPPTLKQGRCFPGGHASGGYAWMSLYFFFLMTRPQWRWRGLAVGAVVGLIFGIDQQLRGAHFLSHDLWTAAICWFVALIVYGAFRQRMTRSDERLRGGATVAAGDSERQ